MEISTSSEIKKLFDTLLVLTNKLEKIKTYYTTITTEMSDTLDDVYSKIDGDIAWMDTQLTKLNLLYSELSTDINEFVAKSDGELIESHVEYQYMTNLFTMYMNDFYERMTSVEITLEKSFLSRSLTALNGLWSFQYTREQESNIPIDFYFESINWTPATRFFEISNNRFFVSNKDGYFFDVNYNTKVVKPHSARSVFKLNKINALYTVHDIIYDEYTDLVNVLFTEQLPDSPTTTTLFIGTFNVATGLSTNVIQAATNQDVGQNFFFIKPDATSLYYRSKNRIFGYNRSSTTIRSVFTPNSIVGAAIYNGALVYNTGASVLAIINKDTFASIRNYSMSTAPLLSGDTGVVVGIHSSDTRIYVVTVLSMYSSTDDFLTSVRETRIDNIGVPLLSFNDTTKYSIDLQDNIYYLYNQTFIYAVNSHGAVVMSPTKLSDKVITIDSTMYSNTAGYAINDDPDIITGISANLDHLIYFKGSVISSSLIGKNVISCDIESGLWIKENGTPYSDPVTGTLVYGDSSTITSKITSMAHSLNDIYMGTELGIIYKWNPTTFTWDVFNNATALGTAAVNSILVKSPFIVFSGQYGRVASYNTVTETWFNYDDTSGNGISNTGSALGGNTIRTSVDAGGQLLFAGVGGRICSVSFSNYKWSRFDGEPDNIIDIAITSPVFNDGSSMGNATIETLIIYSSNILIMTGFSGRVASGFTNSNRYTSYDGTNTIADRQGPGFYNNATAIGPENITDSLIVRDILIISGAKGRIASLNLISGGWTDYTGLDLEELKIGPKIYYDGSGITNKNISALAYDPIRENIYFSGQSAVVGSISLITKESYTKHISKLYYIGKKTGITNEYDSNLVEFSKSNFTERKFLRPPREFALDPYVEMYNGNSWIFKNNGYVYRVDSDLLTIHRSMDTGVSYVSYPIVGSTELLSEDNVTLVEAFVSMTGVFTMHVVVNAVHSLIIGDEVAGTFQCKRITVPEMDSMTIQQVADSFETFLIFKKYNNIFSKITYDLTAGTVTNTEVANGFNSLHYGDNTLIGISTDNISVYMNKTFDPITNPLLEKIPTNKIDIDVIGITKILSVIKLPTVNTDTVQLGVVKLSDTYKLISEAYSVDNLGTLTLLSQHVLTKVEYLNDVVDELDTAIISIDKIYEYVFSKETQAILGFNITVGHATPIKKHLVLSTDLEMLSYTKYDMHIASITEGHAKLTAIDFEHKHIIASININGNSEYYDYLIRYDIIPLNYIQSTQSVKDVWLHQTIDSSYMTGVIGNNSAAIISKDRKIENEKVLNEIDLSRDLKSQVDDIILYHPDYGMILYNSIKQRSFTRFDKDNSTPLFQSSVKAIDGFTGDIADVISPLFDRGTQVAEGSLAQTDKNSTINNMIMFRNAKIGEVVTDSTKPTSVLVRPLMSTKYKRETEYFVSKLNFENGGLTASLKNNDNVAFSQFKAVDSLDIIPSIIGANSAPTSIITNIGYRTEDPKRLVEEFQKTVIDTPIDRTLLSNDLYIKLIRGTEVGFMSLDGAFSRDIKTNKRQFIPYRKNNPPLTISLNKLASDYTAFSINIKSLLSGYSLMSSYMNIVSQAGTLDHADYYIDLRTNKLYFNVATIKGYVTQEFVSPLFSDIIRTHKGLSSYDRSISNSPFRRVTSSVDDIIDRNIMGGYDRISRYSLVYEPYKFIPVFWAPKTLVSYMKSNDSFITIPDITLIEPIAGVIKSSVWVS